MTYIDEQQATLIQNAEELQVNSLTIARQSLEEKDRKIGQLLTRIDVLESMIARLAAQRVPQTQTAAAVKSSPRRWSVR